MDQDDYKTESLLLIEERGQLLLNILKKGPKMVDIALLITLSAMLYRSFIIQGIHIAGDWPYFCKEYINDYLSWPFAWPYCGFPTVYEGIYSLYRFPIRFVQALITELSLYQNIDMLMIYFIPVILLPPIGMYHLAWKLFSDRYIAFFAALVFTFNNVLPWRVALGQPTLAVVMALMPIALSFFIDSVHRNSIKAALLTGIVLSISILYDLRTTYLSLLLIVSYGVYHVIAKARDGKILSRIMCFLKSIILIIFVIGITQAYQIIPIIMATLNPTPLPVTYTTPRALQMLSKLTDLFQILILSHYGWGLEEGPVIPQTIVALIAIGSLLISRDSRVLYLVVAWMIFAFLAKGSIEPMGSLNDWLFINLPLFNWFREPLVFQMVETIPFALLFGVSASKICLSLQHPKLTNQKLTKKPDLSKFSILLSLLLIVLVIWSTWPAFSMTGAYGNPRKSYLAVNSASVDYYQISQWLELQPSGRILMLPQYPSMMYTSSTHQGVILRKSSLPLWGDYLAQLFDNNETNGIAKFLSLYNIRYVVLNPPEDVYWIHCTKPYTYFYSVLNSTYGLKLIDIGTGGLKVFLNEFTLPQVRIVPKAGLIVGSMSDMMRVIELSDLQEWVFQFSDQPSSMLSLDTYSAIIFGKNREIADIAIYMVNECYWVPVWNYASLWSTKETSKWVLGYPTPSNLAQEVLVSPKGLLANPSFDQTAQMNLEFSVSESTLYDIWVRAGAGLSGGSLRVVVDDEELGSITFPRHTDLGLKWIRVGSIQLEKRVLIQLLGDGQVFLDAMIVVPKYVFDSLEISVSEKIKSKAYTLDEFIGAIALDSRFQEGSSNVQWVRRSPSSLYFECTNNAHGYLVFSELYDPLWLLKSESYEKYSIPAYGLINMFLINSPCQEGNLEYIPQRFVDLGVYVSALGLLFILVLLIYLSSHAK